MQDEKTDARNALLHANSRRPEDQAHTHRQGAKKKPTDKHQPTNLACHQVQQLRCVTPAARVRRQAGGCQARRRCCRAVGGVVRQQDDRLAWQAVSIPVVCVCVSRLCVEVGGGHMCSWAQCACVRAGNRD